MASRSGLDLYPAAHATYAPGGRGLVDADLRPFGIAQYDLGATFKPGSGDPVDDRLS
ncbi:hypothetical protein ACFYY1_15385 [Streptomyces sp. NPDC001890]|uniref:hypothetical protein n=1 Tax=Streptomyces sp. NPDC001890 TaxID=3364620 RepID=UPI00369E9A72